MPSRIIYMGWGFGVAQRVLKMRGGAGVRRFKRYHKVRGGEICSFGKQFM